MIVPQGHPGASYRDGTPGMFSGSGGKRPCPPIFAASMIGAMVGDWIDEMVIYGRSSSGKYGVSVSIRKCRVIQYYVSLFILCYVRGANIKLRHDERAP
jgi:hypothetical protein